MVTSERMTRRVATATGAGAAAIGAVGTVACVTGLALLPWHPANAQPLVLWIALTLLLTGLGLVGLVQWSGSAAIRGAVTVASLVVLASGLVALIARAAGWSLDPYYLAV